MTGWLAKLLNSNEEYADKVIERAKADTARQLAENEEYEEARREAIGETIREYGVPNSWHPVTTSNNGASFEDEHGNMHHLNADGSEMTPAEVQSFLDHNYGSDHFYE